MLFLLLLQLLALFGSNLLSAFVVKIFCFFFVFCFCLVVSMNLKVLQLTLWVLESLVAHRQAGGAVGVFGVSMVCIIYVPTCNLAWVHVVVVLVVVLVVFLLIIYFVELFCVTIQYIHIQIKEISLVSVVLSKRYVKHLNRVCVARKR